MFFQSALLAASGFAMLSNAHMIINTPKPFTVPAVRNGPIDPTGINFPCQVGLTGAYEGIPTPMSLGSAQPLAFTGTAVHGGGSCQVSITYDTKPDKNSVWKVIHSIEGGCPAKNTPGNLGDDANARNPFTYEYAIPDDIPTGNATIAWTWLNKVGNREFYMNCAPVTLTGTSGDKSNYDSLPNMLVANIGTGCDTKSLEGKDYKYPNPGKHVSNFASSELVMPNGECGSNLGADPAPAPAPAPTPSPSQPPSAPAPPAPPAPSVAPPVDDPAPAPAPSPSPSPSPSSTKLPGGVFITVTKSSRPTPEPTASSPAGSAPSPSPAPAPPAPPVQQPPADGGSASGAQTAGSACSPEGLWNCVDGKSYQQCGSGVWSPVMPMAAGTKCTLGQSASFNVLAATRRQRRRRAGLRLWA